MKKKWFFMIVLLLIVLLQPLTADTETETGKCGDSLTYTLTDDGTLTISGTGEMHGVTSWKDAAKQVIINEGITKIGHAAFRDCVNLKSITFPSSITTIGDEAFYHCYNLTNISLPASISSIGMSAFSDCISLNDIVIPNSVKTIKLGAFSFCTSLTSVTIPNSVTVIEDFAFSGCCSLASITVPNSVTQIGGYAFSGCSSLTGITIPNSVTYIGNFAFSNCCKLSKVVFYGETITFGLSVFSFPYPTVYCYEYSDTDAWAIEMGYQIVYLDSGKIDDMLSIALPESFRLACGQTCEIDTTVFPTENHPSVAWSSSASEIVSVKDGVATAISPGTATITAIMGTASDSVDITAYIGAEDFELSSTECWVIAKESVQLFVARMMPSGAEDNFTWFSSDSGIATVNDNGMVTTKKPGDVVISAESETGLHRECLVHACYPVTEIAFANEPAILKPGETLQLTANVTMRTQNCVNQLVAFSSSDETVASVSASGLVTALKPGTAKITATADSGISATIEIQVKDAEPETLPGDVNGDGIVDGRDLLRLAKFLAGQDVTIDAKAADMNGDGIVDGRDVLRLAKMLAGK